MDRLIHAASVCSADCTTTRLSDLARAGFTAIDFSIAQGQHLTAEWAICATTQASRLAAEHELALASVTIAPFVGYEPVDTPQMRDRIPALLRTWLENLDASDGLICTMTPPSVLGDAPGATSAAYRDALNIVFRTISTLVHDAECLGVTLAIRAPHRGAFVSPVELAGFLDSVQAVNAGACIDAHRLPAVGRLDDWVNTLGPRVVSVRLPGADAERVGRLLTAAPLDRCVLVSET